MGARPPCQPAGRGWATFVAAQHAAPRWPGGMLCGEIDCQDIHHMTHTARMQPCDGRPAVCLLVVCLDQNPWLARPPTGHAAGCAAAGRLAAGSSLAAGLHGDATRLIVCRAPTQLTWCSAKLSQDDWAWGPQRHMRCSGGGRQGGGRPDRWPTFKNVPCHCPVPAPVWGIMSACLSSMREGRWRRAVVECERSCMCDRSFLLSSRYTRFHPAPRRAPTIPPACNSAKPSGYHHAVFYPPGGLGRPASHR
jgi:hypothetical protein